MPVVVASASRSADALISYALDDKADQKGERYVMASGVGGLLVSVAKHQMRDVRKKWGKAKPGAFVQAYHVIESFAQDELDPDDPNSWMTAQRLGRALAEDRFPGRHALVVTQRDGKAGCLHNHVVVNSVETKTGKSLNSSTVMHARLVEAHERVLEAEGFVQRADLKQAFSDATDRRERGEPSGLRRADTRERSELREFQRHIIWETDCVIADEFGGAHNPEPFSATELKGRITNALDDPTAIDWDSFVDAGSRHGVLVQQRGKKGRGISYGMMREQPDGTLAQPSTSDRRRCSSLGAAFEMDDVDKTLARNSAAQQAQPVAAVAVSTPAQMTLPGSGDQATQSIQFVRERMLAAIDEASAQADANSQQMIATYLAEKARLVRPQVPAEAPAAPSVSAVSPVSEEPVKAPTQRSQTPAVPAVGESPAAGSHDDPASPERAVETIGEAHVPAEVGETADFAEGLDVHTPADVPTGGTVSAALPDDEDAAKLREINERRRRLGLSPVQAEQHAADQAKTAELRGRRLKYPELFEDTLPVTKPTSQDREFGS